MKAWPVVGIALMQTLLLAAHWFVFHTWIVFRDVADPHSLLCLRWAMPVLASSFMIAALLSFEFAHPAVIAIYKFAAVWLGFLNFFFWAACLSRITWDLMRLPPLGASPQTTRPALALFWYAAAVLAGLYGVANALFIRTRRIAVTLSGLPASWIGRTALLMTDVHLGHVNGAAFSCKIVARANALKPDIIFIPGDLFDGGRIDTEHLTAPFAGLKSPLGVYFTSGNHDEFGDMAGFTQALSRVGVRVLANEKAVVDGLHLIGLAYNITTNPVRMQEALERLKPRAGEASILLSHVPNRLPIAEQAGIGLQLSGHTHGGQIAPFNWFTRRVFGRFTYGLQRFGRMQVYTSSGAGTWGPPMRVGTHPEVVLIRFEAELGQNIAT